MNYLDRQRNRLTLTESEAKTLRSISKSQPHQSGFNFLNSHRGLRESKMHLLLGTPGSGKSTIVRSILIDFVRHNPTTPVLIVLSEETTDELKEELAKTEYIEIDTSHVYVISEMETTSRSTSSLHMEIEHLIRAHGIRVLIYDNLTTSSTYNDITAREQFTVCQSIKRMTKEHYLATLLIAHTGAHVTDNWARLITENDVRGSKSITNLTEFLYIMQRFEITSTFYQTIRVIKHRGQSPMCKMYQLIYNRATSLYQSDRAINFQEFKDAYSRRNRL